MNTFAIVAIFAVLASANAGFIAAPSTKIIQGPSSRTTVAGPDGSVISSIAPGGTIVAENHAGLVAHTAPVLAHSAYAAPILNAHTAYAAPVYTRATYAAPVAYAAHGVVSHSALDTLVAGPSGTIATSKTLSSPLVAHAPLAYHGLYY